MIWTLDFPTTLKINGNFDESDVIMPAYYVFNDTNATLVRIVNNTQTVSHIHPTYDVGIIAIELN